MFLGPKKSCNIFIKADKICIQAQNIWIWFVNMLLEQMITPQERRDSQDYVRPDLHVQCQKDTCSKIFVGIDDLIESPVNVSCKYL